MSNKNPLEHLQAIKDAMPLMTGRDAQAVALGLHDVAAAIREHTAAIMEPVVEPGVPEVPNQYLDGSPIKDD